MAKEKKAKMVKIKVPSLFKKKYTEEALEKKIYKKIFVEDDKKFIQNLIKDAGTKGKQNIPVYSIPRNIEIEKKDQKRLKTIAKSIKAQKGYFKILPFVACAGFIAAVGITVTLTKNMICRKLIANVCESAFEAKCDIGFLDLKLLKSSLVIKNIEVADKKEPMKDLFSIDDISVDFDFSQLLRGNVVVEDFGILGIETGKERKTSGDLTAKKLAKIQMKKEKKAKKEAKKAETTPVMEILNKKIVAPVKTDVAEIFNQYNPQSIIENCYSKLEIPKVSEDIKIQVEKINDQWKDKPGEIAKKVEAVAVSVDKAVRYDYNAIQNNPVKIKEVIGVITSALKEVNDLRVESQNVVENLKSTAETVTTLSKDLTTAIKHDTNIAASEINKIKSFKLSDSQKLLSGYFEKFGYSIMGKYYPYFYKIVNKLVEMKKASASEEKKAEPVKPKKEKVKKTPVSRLPGRNVYFRGDTTPRFWIKKMAGSGMGVSVKAANISSDMNAIGLPSQADFTMKANGLQHAANLTVDIRSYSKDPLIDAKYSCASVPVNIPAKFFGGGQGVPSFDTKGDISFGTKIFDAEGFTISGNGDFKKLKITAEPFEPAFAYEIYSNVLAGINSMTVGLTSGYTKTDGLIMKVSTDADKKFAAAITSEMNNQLLKVKSEAEKQLALKISEISGGATGEIKTFDDIKNKINNSSNDVEKMRVQLEAELKKAQDALTAQAKSAIESKIPGVKSPATDAISNSLKGFLKR